MEFVSAALDSLQLDLSVKFLMAMKGAIFACVTSKTSLLC